MDPSAKLAHGHDVATKVTLLLQKRLKLAQEHYLERIRKVAEQDGKTASFQPNSLAALCNGWSEYAVDFAQRTILFWDTLRQRGNNYVEHARQGLPPVLGFTYETVLDGRQFERPVNYALVCIDPPAGMTVDPTRRPYVIIDPRAGHGPGIGGFKDDSQVGVALAAGHPVYFVIFFRDPEPGQTLLDVCEAEKQFVREVRARHPESPKPVIVGNCQGGWAAMMLASADPEDTGPVVINGAPMSYWGGAWQDGGGDNPMRYAGGLLGGSWLSSAAADLGDGIFDGAHLVQNFENLNPANTFWDKYYHLFANVDTEPSRFLEFERWWGGFYLMNREEIEWITRNLFVGNKLWSGSVQGAGGKAFDLREIKAPIILFASMGDNITPPQQAFNWIADIYGSTEEIKARGQVIIGLLHQTVGHLGIFVSGKVAKKEHAQIVSVMQSVEMLPPGLYGMEIEEKVGAGGEPEYQVEFREHRLEEIVSRLNRMQRQDERPFQAVEAISEFNQRAYELFLRPLVQASSNEFTSKLARQFHPLRFQRWAISDANPWLAWLEPAAAAVKAQRRAVPPTDQLRTAERSGAELMSASLDYYRGVRDAHSEASFFSIYGSMFGAYFAGEDQARTRKAQRKASDDEQAFIADALSRINQGGYTAAFARVAYLLGRHDEPLPLARLNLRQDLARDYADFLPQMPLDQWRRIRGEQEIIVRHARDRAIETLPDLLAPQDRERLLSLLERVAADPRVQSSSPTPEQIAMLQRVRSAIGGQPRPVRAALGARTQQLRSAVGGKLPNRPSRARGARGAGTTRVRKGSRREP